MTDHEGWPTDERFRRIAAKIADAVMAHRDGVRISRELGVDAYCPLACLIRSPEGRPGPQQVTNHSCLHRIEAEYFINAFDHGHGKEDDSPFARLGLAYRKRFP